MKIETIETSCPIILDEYSEAGVLDHIVVLFLVFSGIPIVAEPSCIFINSVG